jgi:hypothetical protein
MWNARVGGVGWEWVFFSVGALVADSMKAAQAPVRAIVHKSAKLMAIIKCDQQTNYFLAEDTTNSSGSIRLGRQIDE